MVRKNKLLIVTVGSAGLAGFATSWVVEQAAVDREPAAPVARAAREAPVTTLAPPPALPRRSVTPAVEAASAVSGVAPAGRSALAAAAPASDDSPQASLPLMLSAAPTGDVEVVPFSSPDPEDRRPLMALFEEFGVVDPLDELRLDVRGYVEAGYTYNLTGRQGDDPFFGHVFTDERGDHFQLDQVNLTIERDVDRGGGDWDVGGRLEMIYGFNTYRFHASGLDFYSDDHGDGPCCGQPDDPLAQFDLTQAYVDVVVPVGNGLLVRGGKFVSPIGYESIDPTASPFYSRSYLFGYARPFTHTGVAATYGLDEAGRLEISGGVVRGWDQALKDDNDRLSFIGGLRYRPDDRWDLRFNFVTGPEGPCCCGVDCPENDTHYRTVVDFVARYAATERLGLGGEVLYGYDGAADLTGGGAQWYGAAAYLSYDLNQHVTFNARGEWFHDGDGTRLGTEHNLNVYEVTAGFTLTPFPRHRVGRRLKVRPEIRFDYADEPEFLGGRRHDQVTVGADVIYEY